MKPKIFFQSSLPRAGSTLLQNIIGQNPDFYVTPTSGVLELVYAARANYSTSPEFKAQDQLLMKDGFLSFCRGGIEAFFGGITNKPYVLDKSRGWGIHYNFLNSFYPNPKIVCMVRDPRDIYSSMEKNFRKNQHKDSGMVNHAEMVGTTTEKRVDMWVQGQPVGLAFERLRQMINEGIDTEVLFIKFEDLCNQPKIELTKIYQYLELPHFEHDFNDVKQITVEDDSVYGIYGDHNIHTKITKLESDYENVLGLNAANWIKNHYKWFYDRFGYV
jgi:sulfotransferase